MNLRQRFAFLLLAFSLVLLILNPDFSVQKSIDEQVEVSTSEYLFPSDEPKITDYIDHTTRIVGNILYPVNATEHGMSVIQSADYCIITGNVVYNLSSGAIPLEEIELKGK